jgi:hypothetical protein
MSQEPLTRRLFVLQTLGAVGLVPVALVGCSSGLDCTDTSSLKGDELTQRNNLKYVDATPDPAKRCDNCSLYKRGEANKCGGCTLIKGPINPGGYCTSWAQTTPQ